MWHEVNCSQSLQSWSNFMSAVALFLCCVLYCLKRREILSCIIQFFLVTDLLVNWSIFYSFVLCLRLVLKLPVLLYSKHKNDNDNNDYYCTISIVFISHVSFHWLRKKILRFSLHFQTGWGRKYSDFLCISRKFGVNAFELSLRTEWGILTRFVVHESATFFW
jgi:hypothetical protein